MPSDPATAFLSLLIEDMADEWLSKCVFHNRFSKPENRSYGPAWVMDDAHPGVSRARAAASPVYSTRPDVWLCSKARSPPSAAVYP